MARLDDLDPRWLVQDRADGANVNAWHWSEKDVTNEAKRMLKNYITLRPIYEEGDVSLRVLDLRGDIEGDATALNRRGKKGVFFDFDVKVEWHGEIKDRYGYESSDADGLIVFNVDQQTVRDFDAEVELSSLRMKGTDALVRAMKEKGVAALRNLVARFFDELRAKHDPLLAMERAEERRKTAAAAEAAEQAADAARVEEEEGAFLREQQAAAEAREAAAAKQRAEEEAKARRAAELQKRREEERARREVIDAEIAAAARAKAEADARAAKAQTEAKAKEAEMSSAAAPSPAAVDAAPAAAAEPALAPTEKKPTKAKKTKSKNRDDELLDFICGD